MAQKLLLLVLLGLMSACGDRSANSTCSHPVVISHEEDSLTLLYTGQCVEGKAHGFGAMVVENEEGESAISGKFENGVIVTGLVFSWKDTDGDSRRITGRWPGAYPSGIVDVEGYKGNAKLRAHGQITGSEFDFDGLGTIETDEGIYTGRIFNYEAYGDGEFIGATYCWKSRMIEELGTAKRTFRGVFSVEGVDLWSGVREFDNGDVYTGTFSNSNANGEGVMRFANGDTFSGVFIDGNYFERDAEFVSVDGKTTSEGAFAKHIGYCKGH